MSRDMGLAPVFLALLSLCFLQAGCASGRSQAAPEASTATAVLPSTTAAAPTGPRPTAIREVAEAPQTPTPMPTSTSPPALTVPVPTMTESASTTPTPAACEERIPPDDDLLTLVTRSYGLSREYEPGDLVALSDYFPNSVTLGYPTEVRRVLVEPLQEIVADMQAEGLFPQIISGYRSYSAQTMALQKWREQYPDWADRLSAPPGHSEHQLGTTVDFGSPELAEMLGESFVQFHPAFAQTSEGQWLHERAHEYGFVLSYPEHAYERTEFYYEPWHFRYVGVELATRLQRENLTISEYLLETRPAPCTP